MPWTGALRRWRRSAETGAGRRVLRRSALLLLAPLCAGCYTYTTTPLSRLSPGMEVRAHISDAATERLQDVLGHSHGVVDGSVLSSQPDGVMLLVPVALRLQGDKLTSLNQRVSLPRSDILEIERRTLDRTRTGLLVAAGVVTVGVLVYGSLRGATSQASTPGGPPPPAPLVVPLPFHIMLPISGWP